MQVEGDMATWQLGVSSQTGLNLRHSDCCSEATSRASNAQHHTGFSNILDSYYVVSAL